MEMKRKWWLVVGYVVVALLMSPVIGQAGSRENSDIMWNDGRVVSTSYLKEYMKDKPIETLPSDGSWTGKRESRTIFGEDDRKGVGDVTQSPYRKVVLLEIKFPKVSAEGTGFLISADTILTAAHCLYAPQYGGWAKSITAYVVEEGAKNDLSDESNYKKVTSTTFMMPRGRTHQFTSSFDYGAIKLSEPVGEKNGWFGLTKELLAPYTLSGYHSDGKGKMLTQTIDELDSFSAGHIGHHLDAKPVSSGSPVYNSESQQVMAINVQEFTNVNIGVRINDVGSLMSYAFAYYAAFGSEEGVPLENIEMTPDSLQVGVGEKGKLHVSMTPMNASNKYFKLSSSNPSVASVGTAWMDIGQNEKRTMEVSGQQPGTAVITAESEEGQKIAQATVTVVASVPIEKVDFVPNKIQVYKGEPTQLSPVLTPENATDRMFSWSTNSSYGTITADGVYTGHQLGRNNVTVKVGQGENQKTATCEVTTVDPAVTGVKVTPAKKEIFEGESLQLTAEVLPHYAKNKTIAWSSSNSKIAEVSADGTVKGLKAGTANITVTTEEGNKQAVSTITVKKFVSVKSVKLTAPNRTMIVGEKQFVYPNISPENASNPKVSYTSSDPTVAEITEFGYLTAKKSGKTVIKVTTEDGNKQASLTVTVQEEIPVKSVKLPIPTKTMLVGTEQQVLPVFTPVNASNQQVVWTSSDSSVAEISETGVVQAKKSGKTTVTVVTEDGAKKATGVITVQEEVPVKSVKLSIPAKVLGIGENQLITPAFTPVNASNQKGLWTSSNPAVAAISEAGEVEGIKAGRATITFVSEDGAKKATVAVTIK